MHEGTASLQKVSQHEGTASLQKVSQHEGTASLQKVSQHEGTASLQKVSQHKGTASLQKVSQHEGTASLQKVQQKTASHSLIILFLACKRLSIINTYVHKTCLCDKNLATRPFLPGGCGCLGTRLLCNITVIPPIDIINYLVVQLQYSLVSVIYV